MFTSKIARHIIIPAATVVAAEKATTQPPAECVCKPSELPIYSHSETPQVDACEVSSVQRQEPGAIENAFGTARRGIFSIMSEVRIWEANGQEYLNVALDNAECVLEYLQEPENSTPKYGAVALGGLAGFILALRGRFIRRTIYSSIGALSMAAICYPKEASEYAQLGGAEAKRYATIAYNFVNGVKKDDPPLALPSLPSLPGSISEAWNAAKSIASPVTVADPEQEAEKEKQQQKVNPK